MGKVKKHKVKSNETAAEKEIREKKEEDDHIKDLERDL